MPAGHLCLLFIYLFKRESGQTLDRVVLLTQECEGLLSFHHVVSVIHALNDSAASHSRIIKFFCTP